MSLEGFMLGVVRQATESTVAPYDLWFFYFVSPSFKSNICSLSVIAHYWRLCTVMATSACKFCPCVCHLAASWMQFKLRWLLYACKFSRFCMHVAATWVQFSHDTKKCISLWRYNWKVLRFFTTLVHDKSYPGTPSMVPSKLMRQYL